MKMRLRYHFIRVVPVVLVVGYVVSLMHPFRYFFPSTRNDGDDVRGQVTQPITLHKALTEKNTALVALLVRQGAQVNGLHRRWSPLHRAINDKNGTLVALLLEHGADVHAVDRCGRTPLHHAALRGFAQGITLLLARGAHVHKKDYKKNTPLHLAAGRHGALWALEKEYSDCIGLLIRAGGNGDEPDVQGKTPLHYAAMYGHSGLVNCLLRAGAHVEVSDHAHATPLHYATGKEGMLWAEHQEYYKIVHDLCACGAKINVADGEGKTPLHYAAAHGNEQSVAFLVEHGAAVNLQDKGHATPLHYACGKDPVRFMPRKYASHVKSILQIKDHEQRYKIEENAHCMVVACLLSKGAWQGIKDILNNIPVQYANKFNHEKIQGQFGVQVSKKRGGLVLSQALATLLQRFSVD